LHQLSSLTPHTLPLHTSPLFPYTTLFRSIATRPCASSATPISLALGQTAGNSPPRATLPRPRRRCGQFLKTRLKTRDWRRSLQRSEEHTSELQSLRHLVCRLLLEKKKKNT